MEDVGATVVIDLGLERGEPPTYASPQRSTVSAWFPAAVLALIALISLTGSAAPGRPPLRAVLRLPFGPVDAFTVTDGGQLLIQTYGQLSSYDLQTGRLWWQAGQSTPPYRLRTGAGLVLVRPIQLTPGDPGTTAVSMADGAVQWRRADNVVTLTGSTALLAVTNVRGFGGAPRRVQGTVNVLDSLTGRTRWTMTVPNTAVLVGVPPTADTGAGLLAIRDDRTALLYDVDTGRELGTTMLPAADYNPQNPTVAGGRVLLLYPGPSGTELAAYDPETLRQVWTRPAGTVRTMQACGDMACLAGLNDIRGMDAATGEVRWIRQGWREIEQQGTTSVAYGGSDQANPIGVVDPATGAVQVALDGWRPVGGTGEEELLVMRTSDTGARTMVAVARPGEPRPQLLAELPPGIGDCQGAPNRLVCRSTNGELIVWAYRSKK